MLIIILSMLGVGGVITSLLVYWEVKNILALVDALGWVRCFFEFSNNALRCVCLTDGQWALLGFEPTSRVAPTW